jgi:putative transposase
MIRDRDAEFTDAFDTVLQDASLRVVATGVRMPRMNSVMERWIPTCRHEILDRTSIWNERHLLHALHQYMPEHVADLLRRM